MPPTACPATPQPGHWIWHGSDTARLKQLLGRYLRVDSRSVHAFIIGEHGDSELAVWSGANVSGIDLKHFCDLPGPLRRTLATQKSYRAGSGQRL